jgi:alpha-1,3-mannosyltransferase
MGSIYPRKEFHSIFMPDSFTTELADSAVSMLFHERIAGILGVLSFLAVSIKMNVLLFAPGLLLLFFLQVGPGLEICLYRLLLCCALPQLVLSALLLTFPVSYLRRVGTRSYFYKWDR